MRAAVGALVALLLALGTRAVGQDAMPAPPLPPVSESPEASLPESLPEPAGAAQPPDEDPALAQSYDAMTPLTEAELAALGMGREGQGFDDALHFSGFMDVNVFGFLNPDEAPLNAVVIGDESALFVGHLNLYATKNITRSFSMMAELRFVYSPNGSQTGDRAGSSIATSYTQVLDYTGSGAFARWGGIVVERAYGEWAPWPFLALRLGAFLTPYGIWNVDHGSPVYITVTRPFAVNGNFFPERQTGLELLGRWGLTSALSVRYHFTLSNGLGPVSEYRDLDANKAVGGRLALEWIKVGTLQLGGSAFYGKNTGGTVGFGLNDTGTALKLVKNVADQAWITAAAADLQWRYRGFLFQSEWVGQRLRYTESGRTRVTVAGQVGVPLFGVAADAFNWAAYGLVGYRLPWLGVMPYFTTEYQRALYYGLYTMTCFSKVGLNIRPADAIVVKAEYQFALTGSVGTEVKILSGQVAWAF